MVDTFFEHHNSREITQVLTLRLVVFKLAEECARSTGNKLFWVFSYPGNLAFFFTSSTVEQLELCSAYNTVSRSHFMNMLLQGKWLPGYQM